ncbi:inactive tyrosine-protein kinase 7-like isoform X2 [Eriocheir sinensis]|uniref:inactive tyrosine-protein kinase 7-like isoform X2 n=1 Tax=Eriocheir sinensis TaxID=95602 RepID=UPI0021C70D46|nr:inactive tyrosine-protein kinase 7-like isoform X2 [Eriocheir sinensis]
MGAVTAAWLLCVAVAGVAAAGGGDIFYFSAWPASGRVAAGEERVLRCAVSDAASIALTWHLDGRPITYSSRRRIREGSKGTADLVIGRATPEDAGEYTCIAHNTTSGFALTSLPATLTVLWVGEESRVVLADPKEESALRRGASARLRCRVEGGPDLYYRWYRNGEDADEVKGISVSRKRLSIASFDPALHNGVFTCSASVFKPPAAPQPSAPPLTVTTTHTPFTLALKDPKVPGVRVVPASLVVGGGSSAPFHCRFQEGTAVTWYLNGAGPLVNGSRYTLQRNGTLVVRAASKGDEGVYKCEGRHPDRPHPAAYAASLTLAYIDSSSPPTLEPGANLRNMHVVGAGGRLKVLCLPPPGLPRPRASWVAVPVQESSGQQEEGGEPRGNKGGSAELLVEDVSHAHAGNYTCVASNLAGNSSVSLQLVVTRKPHAQLVTAPLEVLEEETARLECRVDASSRPYTNVTWTRNAAPVSVDDYRISLSGMEEGVTEGVSVLRIRWARLTDAGAYACVVHTLGHPPAATSPVRLSVTERLKFSPLPRDTRVEVGANLSIPCVARGADSPVVTWHRVAQQALVGLPEHMASVEGRLEVVGAELEDAGRYMCVAASTQGAINVTITLSVIESPVLEWVTQGPVLVDRGDTLLLECFARGSPHPSIHWDYNHTTNAFDPDRVEVHGNGTLQVSEVRWEDGGVYGCTAGNMVGLARAEITVTVTGDSAQLLGRTVGVAVGGAAAYIALVGAMLIYCRQRRHRLKQPSPQHARGGATGGQAAPRVGRIDPPCHVQLSQVSTHTLATSTHLGLSQASTKTLGGSSASTRHSSPLQPNSSPSPQSVLPSALSDHFYVRPDAPTPAHAPGQDKQTIQRENLQVLLTLGHGEFGEVQLARLRNPTEETPGEEAPPDPDSLVMVKVISTRDESLLAEVCREAAMFGGPPHPSLVSTIAFCTAHTPHLLLTQYTDWGDLKQFLLATRKESPRPVGSLRPPPLALPHALSLALQTAQGLEYLSGRRHIHRDVAARNCLVTSSLQVKLAAPALTRDAYSTEYCTYRNQVLPVRWLAPEALLEEEHSMKSSVFSWAWLVWEVFTQAAIPHADLTDHQVIMAAERGELRCAAPPKTSPELEALLGACWQVSPKARPSVTAVVDALKALT